MSALAGSVNKMNKSGVKHNDHRKPNQHCKTTKLSETQKASGKRGFTTHHSS